MTFDTFKPFIVAAVRTLFALLFATAAMLVQAYVFPEAAARSFGATLALLADKPFSTVFGVACFVFWMKPTRT